MSKHSDIAVELFLKGYNCTQSVLGAFSVELGLDFEQAIKLASSFGAGMGRLREVCGALTGEFMVAGLIFGYTDEKDRKAKTEHYKLIQEIAQYFENKNGSIICRELLGLQTKKSHPVPQKRDSNYYKKRPCKELVRLAAEHMDELIEKKAEH